MLNRLRTTTFESLANRDFRVLWLGFIGSWTGNQFQQVARGYLAYKLTGSALAIGVVTLAMGLPRVVLSPIGGWLADRYNKRTVVICTSIAMTLLSALTGSLYLAGDLDFTALVALGLAQGVAFSLLMPVRQAYTPQIVGTGHLLPNAVALNTAGMNLTRIAGPAIAGLLIAIPHFGLGGTFFVIASCWSWVTISARRVGNLGPPLGARQRVGQSVRDGFSYVGSHKGLLTLMSLGFVPLAVGMPYINLMPAIADGTLHGGSRMLGLLLSVGGIGSLVGTLFIASFARYEKKATLQLALGVGFGVALVGFASFVRAGDLVAALPFLFAAGMTGDAYQALNSSLIMMSTDPGRYGRVMGVYMIAQSVRPISVLPVGALGDAVGVPLTLVMAGTLVALFVGAVATFFPGYRTIGRKAPDEAPSTGAIAVIDPTRGGDAAGAAAGAS